MSIPPIVWPNGTPTRTKSGVLKAVDSATVHPIGEEVLQLARSEERRVGKEC